jgi:DNA-binding NarL/FixJ family response regulator
MLVGRASECLRIDRLLADVRTGDGGALAVRGEPGIGKTSLLRYAVEQAEGMRVLQVRAVEAEATLPFAALVDLLTPVLADLDRLPERQAAALRSALAVGPALPADRLAVLVGVFNLLCAAAEAEALLVVVDDAQWLDPASREAIEFAARRAAGEPVALLLATRRPADDGLPELVLDALSHEQSLELLRSAGADEAVFERALLSGAGNPLALLELATSPSGTGPGRLEDAYARMTAALPDDCRVALLLLAAAGPGDSVVLGRAMAASGIKQAAFEPAEQAGLVTIGGGTTDFRHPLIRSAVYGSAAPRSRRDAHAALALACVEAELETERIAHAAAAATEPDDELAEAVEQLAEGVRMRGGAAAAIEWYERAAALSCDRNDRTRRLVAAAEVAHAGGRDDVARRLLDHVDRGSADKLQVRSDLLRGRIEARCGSTSAAGDRLLESAARIGPGAVQLLVEAVDPLIRAGRPAEALSAAERAVSVTAGEDVVGLEARIARSASLVFLGRAAEAVAGIDEVAEACERTPQLQSDLQLRAYLGMALGFAGRSERALEVLTALIDQCEHAAIGSLTYPLTSRAWVRRMVGQWDGAQADALRAVGVARTLGRESDECWGLSLLSWIRAARGRLDEELLSRQAELADRLGLPYQRLAIDAARGVHALAAGAPEQAVELLRAALETKRRYGFADITTHPAVGADLVEALVRCGRADDAASIVSVLLAEADVAATDPSRVVALRAAALVEADWRARFDDALALGEHADAFGSARTLLAYGGALLRAGARVEARAMLEQAREQCAMLGASQWEEQAVTALGRSGKVLRRDPSRRDELTPTELQVASLVTEGKTNREIAGSLWMSQKTVEAHLSRIYRKLGVRNRAGLAGLRSLEPGSAAG